MSDTTQTVPSDASSEAGKNDASVNVGSASTATQTDANQQAGNQGQTELDTLNQVMGRSFASLEEAKKHYDSLNSFVGDQAVAALREDAKLTHGLVQQLVRENPTWTEMDAKRYLASLQVNQSPSTVTQSATFDPKQAALEAKLQLQEREMFTLKNPEASQVLPKIEEYAKATGKSLQESYQFLYGEVMKDTREKIQAETLRLEKKGAQVSASGASPQSPAPTAQADRLMEQYRKTGKEEFLKEAVKLRNSKFWKQREA